MDADKLSVLISFAEKGDRQSAWALVEEIGRRDLATHAAYVFALAELCFVGEWGAPQIMRMLTATPEQVAKAAREVLCAI